MPNDRTCSIDGCNKPAYCRGWCAAHYNRWRTRGGDPAINLKAQSLEDRFWSNVEPRFDYRRCWLWQLKLDDRGYGTIKVDGKMRKAHAIGYELQVGTIPDGHEIDHVCRNHACVRGDHLEAVTHQENVRRGKNGVLRHLRESEPTRGAGGKFVKRASRRPAGNSAHAK